MKKAEKGVQINLENKFSGSSLARIYILIILFSICSIILVYRIFDLQIINGESYLEDFSYQTTKSITIPSSRGKIYDCNGELLAYNELAYSVTIQDLYESSSSKNANLNDTIFRMIQMIEHNNDQVINDFNIVLNENNTYSFAVSGNTLNRFLADVYEHTYISDLEYEEETATAEEVIELLIGRNRYAIGGYVENEDGTSEFVPGLGYTKAEILKILTIRYAMSANSYQKYIETTVASEVSEETVAMIYENKYDLLGVDVKEVTLRKYVDATYFSHIIGYTGRISNEELITYSGLDNSYDLNDMIGKSGIEKVMELDLQGKKGTEEVVVNNLGKVIEVISEEEPVAGCDVYLTINKETQIETYKILERQIAGVLISKIVNQRTFELKEGESASKIKIPITDVYYALLNNNIIDFFAFSNDNASDVEKEVESKFIEYKEEVLINLRDELDVESTIYDDLTEEYKVYESLIVSMLENKGVINTSEIDTSDQMYIDWKRNETVSLKEYLEYAITERWVDVEQLNLESEYSSSEEIYNAIVDYIIKDSNENSDFAKRIYKYMLRKGKISGKEICLILWEQDIITIDSSSIDDLEKGRISAYNFMINLITNLDITPAQLALDPCSGSCVITDVNNGDVIALVTYPGYDNNKLANSVDAEYYRQISNDLSNPQWNYATQQKTAPGSTYKMITAIAALEEGIINTNTRFTCNGIFDKIVTDTYHCWIYPGGHGSLNVRGAIKNSCNVFFYEVGYLLSQDEDGYNDDIGIDILNKYASLFGLDETSGVEVVESVPKVSDEYPIQSAIGQGTNDFTTVGLARYVTTIANHGTCYDLTLLDKMTDSNGNLLINYNAEVRNEVDIQESTWNAVYQGMRDVVESKFYFANVPFEVAGKTGTAQESLSRPNHALFVGFAPYDNPEVAISTRIAYGYASDYAAEASKNILSSYFGVPTEELLSDEAIMPDSLGLVID